MGSWVIGPAPEISELDERAALYRDKRKAMDYVSNWICPGCRKEYEPIKNMLVDLPPFGCVDCGLKNNAAYEWKITQCTLNGISLDFKTYDQKLEPHCTLYAITAVIDCTRRLEGAQKGFVFSAPFDINEMVETYNKRTGFKLGNEPQDKLYETYDNCPIVMEVLKSDGIAISIGASDVTTTPVPRLKIRSYFRVDPKDVLYITRLLAGGFPLVAGIRHGFLFNYLSDGQYYCAPTCENTSDAHAVALIGCGVGSNGNKTETFYKVRNSHGIKAHSHYQKREFGGDFIVWSSDVTDVWGLYLAQHEC
ncbi:uncharacterized protein LOC127757388 [Oryza glaberrima]|uniref:Peptidase C1A papain C-terminal domain-containing protein n=1 Tax=Oryza glaberrima TaxID=4538 RepID=I1R4S5_ORYGL|nr:uncharacterized protein LOC127757388 [Oryza glaberrima]